MVQKGIMSRTPSTSTQEIQMDMFDHHGSHAQVRERHCNLLLTDKRMQPVKYTIQPAVRYLRMTE